MDFGWLFVAVAMLAAGDARPVSAQRVWPTEGWPESPPEELGLDRRALDALDRDLASGAHGYVDSMLVIRRGRVAYEKAYRHDYDRLFADGTKGPPGIYNYYDPDWHPYYRRGPLHTMQSVSKSVTSALVGIAIGRGEAPAVGAKVMPFFAEYGSPADPRRDAMTLRDLLTMTTGIRWDEESSDYTDATNNCAAMEGKDDWVGYVLERPMAADPGKVFVYNSGATELLSYLLAKTTRKPVDEYAREHLFAPLGIRAFYWKRTPRGLADTEGGLYLTPRDLAKFGYLYLNDGVWDGKRVLPESWARESTTSHVASNEKPFGYGYQWWVLPREAEGAAAYVAWGYGGQLLIVVPELELIVVFTGWNIYDKPSLDPRVALKRVLTAVRK